MEPGDAELVVNSIDIRLVKEQLRLLGHTVDDAVILSFVEGLGTGAAASNANEGPAGLQGAPAAERSSSDYQTESEHDTDCSDDDSRRQTPVHNRVPAAAAGKHAHAPIYASTASPAASSAKFSDASPSRSQADQQSTSPKDLGYTSPAIYNTLDQRCRKFLARLSERPSSQQLLQQQQQQHRKLMASRELLLGDSQESPGNTDTTSPVEVDADSSSETSDGCSELQLAHQATSLLSSCNLSTSTATATAVASQHNMQGRNSREVAVALGGAQPTALVQEPHSRIDSSDLQSLMQLSSRNSHLPLQSTQQQDQQQQQLQQSRSSTSITAQLGKPAAAAAETAPSMLDQGSEVVYEAPAVQPKIVREELPRFGFRPGYKPIGIHIPPPLAPDALVFIKESQTAAAGAAQHSIPSFQQQYSPVVSSPSGQQQPQLAPWLDVRRCSDSIIGELSAGACPNAGHRPRHTPHDGSSDSDPLYHAPTSPTGIIVPTVSVPQVSRSPAKVIAAAAAASSSPQVLGRAQKPQGLTGPAVAPGSSAAGKQANSKSSSSCRSDLSRQGSYTSSATVHSMRRVSSGSGSSSSSGLSSQAMYSQQLSFGGRYKRSNAVAPGVQKTDRVARFHQMQQRWQKDRFLSGGMGGNSSRPSSSSNV